VRDRCPLPNVLRGLRRLPAVTGVTRARTSRRGVDGH
jgi:hypothetical protein